MIVRFLAKAVLLAGLSVLLLGNAAVRADNSDAPMAPGKIIIDRLVVTPSGVSVSLDVEYSNADIQRLVRASQRGEEGAAQALMDELLAPVFREAMSDSGGFSKPVSLDDFPENRGELLALWEPLGSIKFDARVDQRAGNQVFDELNRACDSAGCDRSLMLEDVDRDVQTQRISSTWNPADNLALTLDYFDSELQPSLDAISGAQGRETLARGVDLNVAMGGQIGDLGRLAVKLQVRKLLDRMADDAVAGQFGSDLIDPAKDAELGVGFSRGSFQGGLTGRLYDDVSQRNSDGRGQTWMSLDLQLTWNAPWDGQFEVGARNLIGERLSSDDDAEKQGDFDHLFGRIPYVQYRHDL